MKESRKQDIIRTTAKALMQYSISAFFLKEVSDMDVYEKLEELQEKALHDETMKQALLATRTEKEPIIAFCKKCQELGYEIYPMELINAGEEFYATMRRSTNGGGENSPKLSGEDDMYELFMTNKCIDKNALTFMQVIFS